MTPISANKEDDTDTITGTDAGTSTNVGDHATHHNELAEAVNALVINLRAEGAVGDGKIVEDGVMTSASAILTSATAAFTAADVGKEISVMRATSTAFDQYTEIESINSATSVELKDPLGFTGTGRTWTLNGNLNFADGGTTADDKTFTSASAAFTATNVGQVVRVIAAGSVALNTTILSYQSATQVTLAANATKSVTGAQLVYGTDDTAALIAALELARDSAASPAIVYANTGMYMIRPSEGGVDQIRMYSNTILRGDGWGTIFRSIGGGTPGDNAHLLGINPWNGGTEDVADNEHSMRIEHLQLQGAVREDGHHQYRHLLSINAATDLVVDWVKFANWHGDAVYLGSGSQFSTLERHNQAVTIQDCEFDGINNDNRQAISIIDCDDLKVLNSRFRNCTRIDHPGAIDIEPNSVNTFPIVRDIAIQGCHFRRIGGGAGVVSMAVFAPQVLLTKPQRGYSIINCTFTDLLASTCPIFMLQRQYPTTATPRNDVFIKGNWFFDMGTYIGDLQGVRGVEIDNNYFIGGGGSFRIGTEQKCLDVSIINNIFKEIGEWADYCFELAQVESVDIRNNVFDNVGAEDLGGGHIVRFANGSVTGMPSGVTVTPGAGSGGTTYSYRVAAIRDNSKSTLASTGVTIASRPATLTGANYNRVSWTADYAPAGFRVYGRTSGSELLMATVGPGVFTWDDTGAVTPSGALPGSDLTGSGNTADINFVNNIVKQGATNRTTAVASVAALHTASQAALEYFDNQMPAATPNLAIAPFVDTTSKYKPARAASTGNVTIPPGGTTLTVDGVALANGDRLLLKNQTTVHQNGLYTVDGVGTSVTLSRTVDANVPPVIASMTVVVDEGSVNGDSVWQMVSALPITLGTTSLRFKRVLPSYAMGQNDPWDVGATDTARPTITYNMPRGQALTGIAQTAITAIDSLHGGCVIPAGKLITNINLFCTAAGAGAVTTFWFAIVRASDRTVLERTTNSTSLPTINVVHTRALQAAITLDADTPVYLAWATQVATTSPAFLGTTAVATSNFVAPILAGNSSTSPTSTPAAVAAVLGAPAAGNAGRVWFWLT